MTDDSEKAPMAFQASWFSTTAARPDVEALLGRLAATAPRGARWLTLGADARGAAARTQTR